MNPRPAGVEPGEASLDVSKMEHWLARPEFARQLLDLAQVIVLLLDAKGRIVYFNPFFAKLCGYRFEEVEGESWFDRFIPVALRGRIQPLFERATTIEPTRGNINPIRTRDGEERLVEWDDTTLRGDDGRVIGLLAVGQDVTDRQRALAELECTKRQARAVLEAKVMERTATLEEVNRQLVEEVQVRCEAEARLAESEASHRAQLMSNPIPIYIWRRVEDDFLLEGWNLASERATKGRVCRLVGRKLGEIYADQPKIVETMERCWEVGRPVETRAWYQFKTQEGERFYHTTYVPVSDDLVMVHTVDETEGQRLVELRARLIERVIQAQEEERRRIARELHDALGQTLTSVQVRLRSLEERLANTEHCRAVAEARELVGSATKEARRLAKGLHPIALEGADLMIALERLAQEMRETHGLAVEVVFRGLDGGLAGDKKLATNLYRMVQEALTNVVRHAEASRATVIVEHRPDLLSLIVEDDGKGLSAESWKGNSPGLGLHGLRERAALLGGKVTLESSAASGTTLYVRIPLLKTETRS